MSIPVVITPPSPSLTLSLVKAHLNVDHTDDDTLIQAYIDAACSHIDGPRGTLGRAVWAQTLELRLDDFETCIPLPCGPVSAITSVKYIDIDGVEQTLNAATYALAVDDLVLAYDEAWPTVRGDTDGVKIRYAAGFSTVPKAIEQALMLLIAHWYANRETVNVGNITSELPFATRALLSPYFVWFI